jgi:hypothetical protein
MGTSEMLGNGLHRCINFWGCVMIIKNGRIAPAADNVVVVVIFPGM